MVTKQGKFKCDTCGRFFLSGTGDQGTMYGDHTMDEPPPPDDFCGMCAKKNFFQAIESGQLIHCWWFKPTWHSMAHSVLKHRGTSNA